MRLTKRQLRAIILEELTRHAYLTEGEDEGGDDLFGGDKGGDEGADEGGDEGGDEEAGGDDAAEEGGDEEGGEEGSEEEGGDEEGGEEEKDEDKGDEEEDEEEAAGPVGDEVDVALKDVMADFEKRALDAAAAKSQVKPITVKKEGRLSLARLLFEADDDEIKIDVGSFAADIARLITNYDTLIDMEGVIYSKAVDFIEKKYGKDYADQLQDTLAREHNIEIDVQQDPEAAEKPIFAVGATGGGGAGA